MCLGTRGVSYYEATEDGALVRYVRDIAEPAIKPAPLQALAAVVNPGLRRFKAVSKE